jgi:hypothetical protein
MSASLYPLAPPRRSLRAGRLVTRHHDGPFLPSFRGIVRRGPFGIETLEVCVVYPRSLRGRGLARELLAYTLGWISAVQEFLSVDIVFVGRRRR